MGDTSGGYLLVLILNSCHRETHRSFEVEAASTTLFLYLRELSLFLYFEKLAWVT